MYKKMFNAYKNYRVVIIGESFLVNKNKKKIYKYNIDVEEELKNLQRAVDKVREEIKYSSSHNEEISSIFSFYNLFLDEYHENLISLVKNERINASFIVDRERKKYLSAFDKIENFDNRQKKDDIEFISSKLLEKLDNRKKDISNIKDKIIIANKISPMDLLFYYNKKAKGVIVEDESLSSHTSIIANSLDFSYMAGIKEITNCAEDGQTIIMDGFTGKIFIDPKDEFLEEYKNIKKEQFRNFELMKTSIQQESRTQDDILVNVLATIDMSDNIDYLSNYPSCGVGLVRTEFIFYEKEFVPSMEEQFLDYKEIALKLKGREITIRTFDFSRDKTPNYLKDIKQNNPAMGLRGIRFSMKNDLFENQFEALIRASEYSELKILIPMISSLEEVLYIKNIEKNILERLNITKKKHKLGIMIETPASVFLLEEIYKYIDFVSFGTNDLLQFFYAVDRNNTKLNHLRNPMNKTFIKFLNYTVNILKKLELEFSICGEIILNEELIPILIALGFERLNIPIYAIPAIKNRIRSISYKKAKQELDKLLQ